MPRRLPTPASTLLACLLAPGIAAAADRPYAGLTGAVLLDNDRVHVERFVLPPGQATGRHVAAARAARSGAVPP